ncbi:MAG: MarR family transcriptional regulator, partial [Clostridia bacterium]|nr:MarR family transcriptional regulator [Clostridia bacterium]
MAGEDELLKLDNQLCFSLYVCSKEVIKRYKPLLEPYGLTYTGYITMMALWEKDNVNVKELGSRLFLDSGTLTPLLKKLEVQGYVERTRDPRDERNIIIRL